MIETRLLYYFLEVAKEKSFSKAAFNLHITQPTLSKQIQDLEHYLNKKLFIRGKEITLTDDGLYLRDNALEIISLLEKTESNFSANEEITGDVFFGLGETFYMRFIAEKIKKVKEKQPKIRIRIFSYDFDPIHEKLQKGILDIGLFIGPIFYDDFEYFRLPYEDRFCLLAPKDSVLAQKKTISIHDLPGLPLIVSNQMMENKHIFDEFFPNKETLNIVATYNLIYNATHLVQNGLGYALCLKNLVCVADCDLIEVDFKEKLTVPLFIAIKRNRQQSKATKYFLNTILK